jgi:hypothetical protein
MSAPDSVYFTDAAGTRFRVLDGVVRDGSMIVANPPAFWAAFRIFRPEEGQRRLFYFQPGQSRAPEPALLEQQLQRAEWLPIKKYETDNLDPR